MSHLQHNRKHCLLYQEIIHTEIIAVNQAKGNDSSCIYVGVELSAVETEPEGIGKDVGTTVLDANSRKTEINVWYRRK